MVITYSLIHSVESRQLTTKCSPLRSTDVQYCGVGRQCFHRCLSVILSTGEGEWYIQGVGTHPNYWHLVAATTRTVGKRAVRILLESFLVLIKPIGSRSKTGLAKEQMCFFASQIRLKLYVSTVLWNYGKYAAVSWPCDSTGKLSSFNTVWGTITYWFHLSRCSVRKVQLLS